LTFACDELLMAGDLSGTVERLSHCYHVQLASTSAHNDGIHLSKESRTSRRESSKRDVVLNVNHL
jgi:hypothetical protein